MSNPDPRHARWLELDQRHVWHPFTQMQLWPEDDPRVIVSGEGNYLFDSLGGRYLDGISSLWCNVHGHRKAELDAALKAQVDRVAHSTLLGQASVPSIELAAALARIAPPGLNKVFYSDSGSTSVEVALKMAYQYWAQKGRPQKRGFVALEGSYHGDTVGSVSVGGIDLFHATFRGLLFPVERIPAPHAYAWRGEGDVLDHALTRAQALLREKADQLAALVVEPLVQGAAGIWTHPKGYLAALARLCREHEVLLVCDEVATGFGRTGTMFAVEQEDVRPDLLCVAKGLTGGYLPLAATLATDEVYSAFLGGPGTTRTFFHGHTYTGNALACAVAVANLELFEKERTVARAAQVGQVLGEALEREVAPLTHVGEVRRRGVMVGVELTADRSTRAEYPGAERVGHRVCLAVRKRGILLRPLGNVVVLMPPLSLTVDEAHAMVQALKDAIVEVCGA